MTKNFLIVLLLILALGCKKNKFSDDDTNLYKWKRDLYRAPVQKEEPALFYSRDGQVGENRQGLKISQVPNGTNQFNVTIAGGGIDPVKLNTRLRGEHNIVFGLPRADGFIKIKVNPTLLRRDNQQIIDSFKEAIAFAGG
jgi:hypothetical protein